MKILKMLVDYCSGCWFTVFRSFGVLVLQTASPKLFKPKKRGQIESENVIGAVGMFRILLVALSIFMNYFNID